MAFNQVTSQQIIPKEIEKEALVALSHYPQLKKTEIRFKFKKNIKKSIMQAQPHFCSFFKSRNKRTYLILISETFQIGDTVYRTSNIPSKIMIGWLGHELGHVMDFEDRSNFGLIGFGIGYVLSSNYMKGAEMRADRFAVFHGMEKYILATKNYILNHADLPEKYKNKIRKYYQSPEQIMQLVNERDSSILKH